MKLQEIYKVFKEIQKKRPLVHCITNYVSAPLTANALLAIGASPVMSHAPEEAEEMVAQSQALVINLGTLCSEWKTSIFLGLRAARSRGIPVVLDPVGAGATQYRTQTAKEILSTGACAVVRANASEMMALSENTALLEKTRGVDSQASSEDAGLTTHALTRAYGFVAGLTGRIDYVFQENSVYKITNGHPMMTKTSGTGCVASVLVGACLGAGATPLEAAICGLSMNAVAGEWAAQKSNESTGSFLTAYMDALSHFDEEKFYETAQIVQYEQS